MGVEAGSAEIGLDRSACSNVANAISRALAALALGRFEQAREELLVAMTILWPEEPPAAEAGENDND